MLSLCGYSLYTLIYMLIGFLPYPRQIKFRHDQQTSVLRGLTITDYSSARVKVARGLNRAAFTVYSTSGINGL